MLSEEKIISTLQAMFPQHIGDDGAVIPFSEKESYVVTKDLLVEDIHFSLKYTPPEALAHKAIHVNLSDLAAMGARPYGLFLGVAIPPGLEVFIEGFLQALSPLCKEQNILLLGGDTTASAHGLFLSVTAMGIALKQHIKYRHLARKGDVICVAGELGYASMGLEALERGEEGFELFKTHFLKPRARVEEGIWLGQQNAVTAMMDLSDGLWVDLHKLCKASQLGAHLHCEEFPMEPEWLKACKSLHLDPREQQLSGGEDYGLLFTVQGEEEETLRKAFEKKFAYSWKKVGVMTERGIQCFEKGMPVGMPLKPFSHFGELK